MAKKQPIKFLGIKTTKKGKKVLTIVSVLLGLILADLFTPFGGNIRFMSEWARCGSWPYVEDGMPGGGVRFYSPASKIPVFRQRVEKYYCTPIEAERDGLSAYDDTWDYPHLRAAGENHPYTKKPFLNRQ